MNTQKPLQDLLPEILVYIHTKYSENIEYNKKLLDIYDGQLRPYVEDSMRLELSPESFARAKERIAPINLCTKIIDKLSRVYVDPASRNTPISTDKDLLDKYEVWYDLDNQMALANTMLSLNKYCALEPYIANGKPGLRVIPATQFLVWSDNTINPDEPTVFIKFTGSVAKETPATDSQGRILRDGSKVVRSVQKFTLYSETEILEMDMDGEALSLMPNPYNKIPFVYIKNSKFQLIPVPDTDLFSMTILIPKLLADLNYAVQFQSHSVFYCIDADPSGLSNFGPDSMVVFTSKDDGKAPQIGTIDPKVDSEKVIELIKAQVALWLDSKGLKVSSLGNIDGSSSGIAKMIDESDVTSIRKTQVRLFNRAEHELWELTSLLHNSWVAQSLVLGEGKAFTSQFNPSVTFSEQKPVVDTKSVLDELKGMKDLNLFTPKRALQKLYPALDDTQIESILNEIQVYNQLPIEEPDNDNQEE